MITGGAKRIGKVTALALANNNLNLVLHYGSSYDEAEAVASECRNMGVKAYTIQADLQDYQQSEALFESFSMNAGVTWCSLKK